MMEEARPLTPRPHWFHCRGLLDPDYQHTVDKAENSQEMLQHMLLLSRTLLSAYGLSVAANKSQVFEQHEKHPLTLPMAVTPADDATMLMRRTGMQLRPNPGVRSGEASKSLWQ